MKKRNASTSNDTCAPPILSRRFAIYVAPGSQSLVNLAPLCARVARAVEGGGLNAGFSFFPLKGCRSYLKVK
ncbi:MAG: hypothetical protein ACFFCS_23565 [Candidatus Hodarchaeota archaeon]